MKPILIFFLTLLPCALHAQYKGGSGDGAALASSSGQLLGPNIFLGGTGDGSAFNAINAQLLGPNIYTGGTGDGYTFSTTTNALLGPNIFLGGSGDGYTAQSLAGQLLGFNIYVGGSGDGFASAFVASAALPLTLESFTAERRKTDAFLQWTTSNELNTSHFEVEKSADGINFNSIGKQKASGNSTTVRTYEFTDVNALQNISAVHNTLYYRLRTFDKDGKYYYSGIVVLKFDSANKQTVLTVYPNPAHAFIVITVNPELLQRKPVIRLTNMNGNMVAVKSVTASSERVAMSTLPAGIYILTVSDALGNHYIQKIIKE